MSEVKHTRYTGPFEEIPFENYIQSPIGLVPKAGNKTRQIFHLSYNFKNGNKSLNAHTLQEKCSVKYNNIDSAVKLSLELSNKLRKQGKSGKLRYSKSDLTSAFGILPLKVRCFKWLVMKAEDPTTRKTYYFVNKFLLFGASISCSHFQCFSNALKHLVQFLWNTRRLELDDDYDINEFIEFIINYLDDFLFIAKANRMMQCFKNMCDTIRVPVSEEKSEWGSCCMVFLGILLDGNRLILTVPEEKRCRATNMINQILSKRKVTVKDIEKLAGFLNFLNKAIVPGHAFMRCMYAKFAIQKIRLKPHHHITLDSEFKEDCRV